MSDTSETPWSNGSNAPQIPPWVYPAEKESFAGFLLGAIFYGVVVALFFQCMGALLSPTNLIRRGIKWALVAHTVAMFLFLTIPAGIDLNRLSVIYINNRNFPGDQTFPPGPLGYGLILQTETTNTVFEVMFPLNQWLADGLLLHRCYVIYSINYWVMVFPCLMYLASVAMAIGYISQWAEAQENYAWVNFGISYYSISLSLNVLLTLMIIMRLILHIRNIRKATGALGGSGGLHTAATAVVTMLIESYALYAITLLAYTIPWAVNSWVATLLNGVVGAFQVIAPYLIILRVARRRAMTSQSISGISESIHFRSQGSMYGEGYLSDGDPTNTAEISGEAAGEPVAGDENTIEEVTM